MSDTSPTPIPIAESSSSPTVESDRLTPGEEARVSAALALAEEQAAPGGAPMEPPPISAAPPAGAEVPPAGASPEIPPGAAAPVEESKPVPAGTDVAALPLVDSPEAARGVLGDDAGIAAVPDAPPEHPYDTLQRMRAKLAAYGEECLKAVQPEMEYLLKLAGQGE